MKLNINNENFFVIFLLMINVLLFYIPVNETKNNYEYYKSEVISVDNSEIQQFGIIKQGEQYVELKILNGEDKNKRIILSNILIGKMELDKNFKIGDKVLIEKNTNSNSLNYSIVDFYRADSQILLILSFSIILILISGWTGVKSLLSFTTTILFLWKIMIPLFLKGYNPIIISLLIVSMLTFIIIFLVAGFNKKGLIAFLGAISGVLITIIISELFSRPFYINGSVKPFSETLLYSGYYMLDLNKLFISGIFLASSGAVMDISMDISASMNEVKNKAKNINSKELIKSGLNVGKAVIGTMATTLLLAYSGGYATLLMAFMAKNTNEFALININYISSEILNIIVGSFGLVLTAPLTAIIGGFILSFEKKNIIKINKKAKNVSKLEL
ncbi:YibE/F family protein [Oceanotoga sp. DSM 15011]|uniref:YibE/F family protein n=1 Tax=Oceanotoga sp. DSM 15011 TaxID=2984951 RepID=UPI0021F49944|nr:YibE/F family protein [Oceanotoga sp. DSM 15011]UYP01442.1 YibE/F family protein [Oceanotoga sp. DSM 15011]